jgi:hypothetical protein
VWRLSSLALLELQASLVSSLREGWGGLEATVPTGPQNFPLPLGFCTISSVSGRKTGGRKRYSYYPIYLEMLLT